MLLFFEVLLFLYRELDFFLPLYEPFPFLDLFALEDPELFFLLLDFLEEEDFLDFLAFEPLLFFPLAVWAALAVTGSMSVKSAAAKQSIAPMIIYISRLSFIVMQSFNHEFNSLFAAEREKKHIR